MREMKMREMNRDLENMGIETKGGRGRKKM